MAYILWFILFITAFALIVNFFRSLIEFSETQGVGLTIRRFIIRFPILVLVICVLAFAKFCFVNIE